MLFSLLPQAPDYRQRRDHQRVKSVGLKMPPIITAVYLRLAIECALAGSVRVLEFDATGRRLAAASDSGKVFVWSLDQPGEAPASYEVNVGVTDIEFSPNGRFLALAGWSRRGES